jgi:DNA-binding GntR family transcriptional regulator
MTPHVHSFAPKENKVEKLSKWLISWIVMSLKNKKIREGDLLPSKAEIACHIGVSQGTMQNVFRFVEDAGYIESKQKIGSYVKDRQNKRIEKLTSKKDLATNLIKKYLKENKFEAGDSLPPTRKLAEIMNVAGATIRASISKLILEGILEKKKKQFVLTGRSFRTQNIEAKTLVEKVAGKIKKYIIENLSPGDKLPPSVVLSEKFEISLKTVHDGIKLLAKEGIVYSRRGQYGTVVMSITEPKPAEFYNYEKIESKIKLYIKSNCKTGDRLPSIKMLAKEYSTSGKTIKKALDNLADEGYVTFARGRFGGTFVTDVPSENDSYTWLAISSDYINNNEN